MKLWLACSLTLWCCLYTLPARAQKDSLFQIPAEEILKNVAQNTELEVTIANKRKQTLTQAPAIVTVITEREIRDYGCRDIADILRLIPGFEFGIDVQSLFGLGFRGIWAHEGKALVMINNLPINCFGYGNGNFFGSVPSTAIDRVEVIRGPGSTLYGGFAEVAVINIITKNGKRLNGVEVTAYGGFVGKEKAYGGNLGVGFTKDQLDLNLHIGTNSSPTSARQYTDYTGKVLQMGNQSSWRRWSHIIAEGTYRHFYFSYNRVEQNFMAQDIFGTIPQNPVQGIYTNELNFVIENIRLHYEIWLSKKFRLKPNIEASRGNPISTSQSTTTYPNVSPTTYLNPADLWQNNATRGRKWQFELEAIYNISDKEELLSGAGTQINTLRSISAQGNNGLQISPNLADTVSFIARTTWYAFTQYTRQGKKLGFTTGARAESTPFGTALVPRLGFTYVKNNFNAKILYGKAFRVPLLYQAYSRQYTTGVLVPEITNTFDLELGYKFKQVYLRANAFHTDVNRPITYIGANNSYQNYGEVRAVGFEAEAKWQTKQHQFFGNLAYSVPVSHSTSKDFMNQTNNRFLALPTLKVNVGGSLTHKKLTVGTTATWLSRRDAQTKRSALESSPTVIIFETEQHPSLLLWNVNVALSEVFSKSVSVRVTGYNVLNAPYFALQPYYGGHPPMPVSDRQVDLALIIKI